MGWGEPAWRPLSAYCYCPQNPDVASLLSLLSVVETAIGSQNSSQYRGEVLTLTYHIKPLAFALVAPCTAVGSTDKEHGWHHNEQVALCSAGAVKQRERRAARRKGTNIEEVQMEEKERKFTHNLERKNQGKDGGTDNYTKTRCGRIC